MWSINICNFQSLWFNKMMMKSCHKHIEYDAVKYCTNCKLFLCWKCIDDHQEKNKDHELIDATKIIFNLCNIHKKEYIHYCIDCKKEICHQCLDLDEHKNHITKKISNNW